MPVTNDDISKMVEIGALDLELVFGRDGKPESDWPVWRVAEVLGRKRNPRIESGIPIRFDALMRMETNVHYERSVTEYGIVFATSMGITAYSHADWTAWADGTYGNPFMSLRHLVLSVAEARDACLRLMKANRVRQVNGIHVAWPKRGGVVS